MRKVKLDGFENLQRAFGGNRKAGEKTCAAPGCDQPAEHRAPKSPQELNSYIWFCLEHVQQYNKAWNYYADMSEDEIERHIQADSMWQRPVWPLGSRVGKRREGAWRPDENLKDPYEFEVFQEGPAEKQRFREKTYEGDRRLIGAEAALAELELSAPVDFTIVKARYKELVKRYHPDANGGDTAAEERLKEINQAYAILKKRLSR